MNLPAAPTFIISLFALGFGVFAVARSIIAYERELFVERAIDVHRDLSAAMARGEITDSPKAQYLLRVARTSMVAYELLTPLRLSVMLSSDLARKDGKSKDEHTAPKADRHALDRYANLLSGAWVRLLMLGSPSGWFMTATVVPGATITAIKRHRQAKRVVSDEFYERLVEPTDVGWLKPNHRGRTLILH